MISNETERCETRRRPTQQIQQKVRWINVCVVTPGIVLDIGGWEPQEPARVAKSFHRVEVPLTAYRAVMAANADPVDDHDGSETKHQRHDPALEIETHRESAFRFRAVLSPQAATTRIRPVFRERGFRRMRISMSWSSAVNRFMSRSTENPASLEFLGDTTLC